MSGVNKRKTILIISQTFVPDPASVGQHMADVAQEMARHGHRVIVFTANRGYRWRHFEGRHTVERFQPHRHIQIYKERHPSLPIKFLRAWRFRGVGRSTIKERPPKIVIAYDPNAMWAAGPLWKRRKGPRVLWHFHELFLPKARDGTASGSRKGLGAPALFRNG